MQPRTELLLPACRILSEKVDACCCKHLRFEDVSYYKDKIIANFFKLLRESLQKLLDLLAIPEKGLRHLFLLWKSLCA